MFAAPAARFADNLFPAMRANLLHTLFHTRQPYFTATRRTDTGYVSAAFFIVIKEVARHDGFLYPAFQAARQSCYTGHAADNAFFLFDLPLTPAAFLYCILQIEQRHKSGFKLAFEIFMETRTVAGRIECTPAAEIPAAVQAAERSRAPYRTAVIPMRQC